MLKIIAITLFLLVIIKYECLASQKSCKEPSHKKLHEQLYKLAPHYRDLLLKDVIPDKKLKKCPKTINETSSAIQDISISPWSYRVNKDSSRFPAEITEAYCLCKNCLISEGSDQLLISEKFEDPIPVLRRTRKCRNGHFVYKLDTIKVPKFCVCTRR